MKITRSEISDVLIIEPEVFGDHRGFFMEIFRESMFDKVAPNVRFVQENHSRSVKGTMRGMHYQLNPMAQGKFVRVSQGSVYDVAVDLRLHSPTYKQWVGIELNEDNKKMLYIPEGFAHGFYVLSETSEFIYKCTNYYSPEHERAIMWDDPEIDIQWPEGDKILSDRDKHHPSFLLAEMNF
jgi:dTDP-4-dehydrorhamnose 3,5-epimerase